MEKDFEDFISKRCENALLKNNEYVELQKQLAEARKNKDIDTYGDVSVSMQIVLENIIYRAAIKDMHVLFDK